MAAIELVREIMPGASIHPDARIGRWCVIGPNVVIGPGAVLADRVTVIGHTRLGARNRVGSGSVIGAEPQDLKFRGGETMVLIGDDNVIGRNVTVNAGTEVGGWVTYIGRGNRIGDAAHVAHDCYITDEVTLGTKVLLAGHVVAHRGAQAMDMTGVHHFVRLGEHCLVGARTPVRRDVPPFTHYFSHDYYWDPPEVRGVNEAGIEAACDEPAGRAALKRALEQLFFSRGSLAGKIDRAAAEAELVAWPQVAALLEFCRQSNAGAFGRYREQFRGQIPPEAEHCLDAETLARIRKEMKA